ncbi:hypothetical protein KAR91_59215 [Candidatus Pacearchaeota archaeon]|nr:hypothetical protein [Candidatus Pacearchaeota archaeon]
MKKNEGSQIIGAEMLTAADGSAFVDEVTCYFTIDGGTQTIGSVGIGICTYKGNGLHTYTPIAGETNGDHIAWTFIGTGAVPVTIQVYPGFPQSVDNDTKISTLPTVAQIWSHVTRSLTDKLGFFISGTKTILDDLNDLSLGDIQGEIQTGVMVKKIVITGDPFEIVEGNIKTLVITLGTEWDLTDKLVYFVMSKINSSDEPIINRIATITDAINGVAEIDLLSPETTPTGCYEYQVELRRDPEDDEAETAMEGTAEITENLRS